MAQETVIHRVDAELAAGVPVAAVPDDLAADGIDELLVAFVQYSTVNWPEEFAGMLPSAGDRTVSLVTPRRSWRIRLTRTNVRVEGTGVGSPDATVEGSPAEVLLWLWSRGGTGISITGDTEAIVPLRKVLVASTQ